MNGNDTSRFECDGCHGVIEGQGIRVYYDEGQLTRWMLFCCWQCLAEKAHQQAAS